MIIKKFPEDFVVEEIPIKFSGKGDYSIYRLEKKDYTTESAVEYLCKKFNIPRKNIKYAGTKDRHAITIQYISILRDKRNLKLDTDNIKIDFVSFHNEPLSLGSLQGNNFKIKIRELSVEEIKFFEKNFINDFVFPNYFDDQRFSENNLEIGVSILKKDFKKACELIGLDVKNNNYVSALKSIPQKNLLFYIHAVQAFVFNKELSELIIKKDNHYLRKYRHGQLAFLEDKNYDEFPKMLKLVGFDSENKILNDLGLTSKDFIIKQFPELSVESVERECFVRTNLSYKKYNQYNEIDLEFSLPKGSYATMLIKALF